MSKWKKFFTCILLAGLALSLCSCRYLDEMRKRHAVWNNETEILWNGAAYRRLPKVESEHLYGEGLTITDPEIPVLLSDMYGVSAHADPTGRLIIADYAYFDGYSEGCYARSDVYDLLNADIRNPVTDHFCADISIYTHSSGETVLNAAVLSDGLSRRLENLMSSGEAEPLTPDEEIEFYSTHSSAYEDDEFGSTGSLTLHRCSPEMVVMTSFGSLFRYISDDGKTEFLFCSAESSQQTKGAEGSAEVYLLKDGSLYHDIMCELTGK